MTTEELFANYEHKIKALQTKYHWERIKPNPNHWPIINKWNMKYIYNPSRHDLYDVLSEAIEEGLKYSYQKDIFRHFCNVEDVVHED